MSESHDSPSSGLGGVSCRPKEILRGRQTSLVLRRMDSGLCGMGCSFYLLRYQEPVQMLWRWEWSPEPSPTLSCLLVLVGLVAVLDTMKSFQSFLACLAFSLSCSSCPQARLSNLYRTGRPLKHLPVDLSLLCCGSLHPLSPSLKIYGAVSRRG